MTQLKITLEKNNELIGLRANARFFLDSYKLSMGFLAETKINGGKDIISSQAIPGVVSLLFSCELLLKLAYLTDLFLNNPGDFKFSEKKDILKNDFNHCLSKISKNEWIDKDLKAFFSEDFYIFIKEYDRAFARWRYFFESDDLIIKDIDRLFESVVSLYNLIVKIHGKSNFKYLQLQPNSNN
jgi:hypothetical protein